MATPSSSTTTPSPRPMFLQAAVVVPPSAATAKEDPSTEKEERQKTIQKFLASAELSQLARGLRTRLAYASFKATHNLTHNTLPDLEAQALSHATSAKLPPAKVPSNHYNNPATQGNIPTGSGTSSRASPRKGAMAPPPVTASAAHSLYASLLQPPPSKRARTVLNPQDPPLAPPPKQHPATPPRKTAKSTRGTHSAQAKSKSRKDEKGKRKASPRHATSRSKITPHSTLDSEGFVDEDVDMKAAATLTSLLHSRPSKSATASSPRSSLSAGSDGGSTHSYSQYAQSSTRSTAPTSALPSAEQSFNLPAGLPRASTPPRHMRTQSLPHQGSLRINGSTTPKSQIKPSSGRLAASTPPVAPSDTEAADLMLYLATSPSPVRPATSKDAKDPAVLRTLSGGSTLRGRVLFGQGNEDRSPRPLRRDVSGSFNSVATEPANEGTGAGSQDRITGAPATSSLLNPNHNRSGGINSMQDVTATSTGPQPAPIERIPTQLLPAPSSPTPAPRQRPPHVFDRPRSVPAPGDVKFTAPPTPGNSSFNLSEYINVSPSPASAGPAKQANLRTDIGRRLFEEHHAGNEPVPSSGLAAGIDLVKSPV